MDKQNEKDNTLEFISMYRNHECLWTVQCKDYSNFFFSLKIIAKPSAIASSRERGIVLQPPRTARS